MEKASGGTFARTTRNTDEDDRRHDAKQGQPKLVRLGPWCSGVPLGRRPRYGHGPGDKSPGVPPGRVLAGAGKAGRRSLVGKPSRLAPGRVQKPFPAKLAANTTS